MPLRTRVGIATGVVVVGEIIGAGAAQERSIVGETPNLASRLQALARPDTIMISQTTQRLVGGLFEVEPAGTHELKGFLRPLPVWRVLGEAATESRFAATRSPGNAPLIGRANEIGLLLERWRLAQQGEGQIVTVIGEPGIGKSRLIEALHEEISGQPFARIRLQCSPYHSDSALYPLVQHLGRAARFAAADSPDEKSRKLAELFSVRAARDQTAVPLLADLMSLPAPEGAAPLEVSSAQRKAATISLLIDDIVRLGETEPVLLILEDAHWIDASTLELITRLADRVGMARALVLVTGRPEFAPPWQSRPHASLLTLGRLGRGECAALVVGVAAAHGLAPETVAEIVAKTDGVPLFAEELTRSVMEQAGEGGATVPATLKDSLMARLDRLGDARELAQIAAVFGRVFPFALLEAVVPNPGGLEAPLAKLVEAGIVFPEGRDVGGSFSFKHALVRDAAYESLLLTRRRDWHERIARALEERFHDLVANEPELLAHHFEHAGLSGPASTYRMRAGDRAFSRSAFNEAIAQYTAGLKVAGTLVDVDEGQRRRLEFLLKLGPVLMTARGYQDAEAAETYDRAAEIAETLGDSTALFKAKWGLWLNANIRRKTALALDRASELVALAQRSGDNDLLLEGYHCRWSTSLFRGNVGAVFADCKIGIGSYDMERHRHLGAVFGGHDTGVCACAVNGLGPSNGRSSSRGKRERRASNRARRDAGPSGEPGSRHQQRPHDLPARGRTRNDTGARAALDRRGREICDCSHALACTLACRLGDGSGRIGYRRRCANL